VIENLSLSAIFKS